MMQRRDVLKLLSLSTLALAGGGVLAACGSDSSAGGGGGGTGADGVRLVSADVPRASGDPAAIAGMVAALHASGGSLLGSVGTAQAGNLALSPYSVLVAMALTVNGAVGETRDQLLGLYGGADTDTVNGGFNALTAHIESLSGEVEKRDGTKTDLALDAANALFGQQGVTWEEPFLEALAREYGAGLQTVDYEGDTEAARGAINSWTAEQTRDKIPTIIPAGALDAMTRLVLVNTLYLKAPWEEPFEKGLTETLPFTLVDGSQVQVPLMHTSGPVYAPYATGDGWAAVQLAYAGGEVAMTVVLPDEGRYADIEADVVSGALPDYLSALAPGEVTVQLPSWTFRTQAPLKAALEALGVEVAFDPDSADFSAMTTEEQLFVAAVLHEVYIAVDEEGTEAAAATAVMLGATSAPVEPLELVADRPFLFVIHDVEHGTPLFLGRVLDPSQGLDADPSAD
ncbi:serpin family protein [soil metagenome]